MSLPDTARSLGLGKLALHLYHNPIGRLRDCLREGGPLQQLRTERGRAEMEAAALTLPQLSAVSGTPLEPHLLTGRRFWFQTAFCLQTLACHSGRPIAPVIYDDGSLELPQRDRLTHLFPQLRFVSREASIAGLDRHLPVAKFPHLRERWLNYPNLRKLIDPHCGRNGWKLVIDSDLLFFRRPDFLLDWLDRPKQPLHAVDCETSYGYPRPLLDSLAGAPLADLVNVGLCGLNSSELDWEKIEFWCRTLLDREGTSYYLEQALVAMLVAGRPCAVAPVSDYVTLPDEVEAHERRAVMHHYVAESKRWYFQENWTRALGPAASE